MKPRRSPIPTFSKDQSGAPLVELALALPFLLVMTFGAMEFANILYQQNIVTKGVQEAARFVARSPALVEDGNCPPTGASLAAIQTAASNVATTGRASGGTNVIPNFSSSDITITIDCVSSAGLISSNPASGSIPVVNVSANITAHSLGFLGFLNLTGVDLSASHQEMGIGL